MSNYSGANPDLFGENDILCLVENLIYFGEKLITLDYALISFLINAYASSNSVNYHSKRFKI